MRYGKIIIGFLTVILLGLIFVVSTREEPVEERAVSAPFFIYVESGDQKEQIQCWEDEEDHFVVFLPGYAKMEQVSLISRDENVTVGDVSVKDGMSCEDFELNKPYSFSSTVEGTPVQSTITFVRSGGVPTLYIDVQSGNMEYIHLDKTNEEPGTMRLYGLEGEQLYAGNLETVKGRGNTSWGAEKKPYNLTLAEDADLLGMGAAQRWILLAEGYNGLNIRNKIVYDFADAVGMPYSPDCEWVDLYLNGEYAGLYLLSERNEVHPERVNISEQGSFLISMENQMNMDNQKIPYVSLGSTQVLRVRYASMSNQKIEQLWSVLKNALLSEDGKDSETGKHWLELIDLDSWVRKYLIEEVFANPDAGAVSQYFYLDGADPEGKIYAGPVWDYDYSMGGEGFWMREYPSFLTMAREYTDDGMYLPWFYELYQKEEFYSRLTEMYETEFLPLLGELTDATIDRYVSVISKAGLTDGIRWSRPEQENIADVEFICAFLETRMQFLSDLWINKAPYHVVQINPGWDFSGYFAVKPGECLPELPSYDDIRGLGWFVVGTDEPFDITQPIYEDVEIYVKKAEFQIPKIHYIPAIAVILVLLLLVVCDRIRSRKNGRLRDDPIKVK